MGKRLQDKPYVVLLVLYWVVLFMRIFLIQTSTLRILSLATLSLIAFSYGPTWLLALTVPALWVDASKR